MWALVKFIVWFILCMSWTFSGGYIQTALVNRIVSIQIDSYIISLIKVWISNFIINDRYIMYILLFIIILSSDLINDMIKNDVGVFRDIEDSSDY